MTDMSASDEELAAQSNQFIGWYEGYHGRDQEIADLKAEIERLRTAQSGLMKLIEDNWNEDMVGLAREIVNEQNAVKDGK